MRIRDFVKGEGPEVFPGYSRGDTWVQTAGPHVDCEGNVRVLGVGWGPDSKERLGEGVLVRCTGCFLSWVLR